MTAAEMETLQQQARDLHAAGHSSSQIATIMLTAELQAFALPFGVPLRRKAARRIVARGLREYPLPHVAA